MRTTATLLTILTGAAGAQVPAPGAELLRCPSGARFLLVPRPLAGVVHWASYTRLGRIHEPVRFAGLAAACARSSLAGPADDRPLTGEEEQLLRTVDRIAAELTAVPAPGPEQRAGLEARLVSSHRELARLGSLDGFRDLLAAVPSCDLEVHCETYGTLLHAAIPRSRVLAFAELMERRRRAPGLVTLQRELLRERERLGAEHQRVGLAPGAARRELVVEALLLALRSHPLRAGLLPMLEGAETPTREEARAFWNAHQRPERCVTVLIGDFDMARVRTGLTRIFQTGASGTAARPLSVEPEKPGLRSSERILPGPRRSVRAYRVPSGLRPGALTCLAELLGAGSHSLLADLRIELGRRVHWQVTPRLPTRGEPAFFVIETRERGEVSPLQESLDRALEMLRSGEVPEARLRAALRRQQARERAIQEDSRAWAATLARDWALIGEDALAPQPLGLADLTEAASRLLVEERLTRVRSRAPKAKDGD